jgi:hypothetical protein
MSALATSTPASPPSPARRFRGVVPNVGVWPNIPFEEYAAWDALNHSTLKVMGTSPKHFKHAREKPEARTTDALRFGTLMHTLLLEPERFPTIIVPAPINEKTGKPFGSETKAWAEYAAAHEGKLIVTDEEVARLRITSREIRKHEDAKVLFEHASQSEVCIVWDCPITGLRCKGRVDLLISLGEKKCLRADLKSCTSTRIPDLESSLTGLGYHTQDAFYAMGMEALGLKSTSMIIAAESDGAHDVVVYEINDETRIAAKTEVTKWLTDLRRCNETGHWPGCAERMVQLGAPAWYWKQFTDGD